MTASAIRARSPHSPTAAMSTSSSSTVCRRTDVRRTRPASFPLGHVVATPGALEAVRANGVDVVALIRRHTSGDWGDLGRDDALANDLALDPACPARVLSAYETRGGRLWVITEADRSATTVLLPSEY